MSSGQSSAPALAPVHGETGQPPVTYTEFHPRWYRPQISTYWWLGKWPYVKFILRELTSVAVAWTVAVMLMQIFALTHSGAFYDGFEALMALPVMILVNVIAFAFLVFHSVTWFNLAPKAMAVRVRGKRVPGILISGPQYLAWIAVSAIVLFILATHT